MANGTKIFPPIKIGKKEVSIGRILRFLAGIGIVVAMILGKIAPRDKWELAMWLVAALLLIDYKLIGEAAAAWKSRK